MLLTKIVNLLGIKDPISELNKQDIMDMLDNRFKNISLQEINYAFKLERHGQLEPKTQHFQLFNAEYMSPVLTKYKKWLQETRRTNNLPMTKIELPKEKTQEEKDLIIYEGLIFCYDNWVQAKEIINGQTWIHDHLMELGLLDFTADQKKTMWEMAKSNLEIYSKGLDYESAKELMAELSRGKSSKREVEYKKIRLKRYFSNIYVGKKHLRDFI